MRIKKEIPIPLYLRTNYPVTVYIIESEVFWIEERMDGLGFPNAPKFLCELYEHKRTRHVIPAEMVRHCQNLVDEKLNASIKGICFCGDDPRSDEGGISSCLAFNMKILPFKKLNVLLHDFAFIQRYRHGLPIDFSTKKNQKEQQQGRNELSWSNSQKIYQQFFEVIYLKEKVTLSAEEAFLLFANMCIPYLRFLEAEFSKSFDDNLKSMYISSENHLKESGNSFSYHVEQFCLTFLIYLSQQLTAGILTPEKILQLNGADSLIYLAQIPVVRSFIESIILQVKMNYDNLSPNEKILFYILLLLYNDSSELAMSLLAEFQTKYRNVWIKLSWEVKHEHETHYIGKLIKQEKVEKQYQK